jgi:hypothetical protein
MWFWNGEGETMSEDMMPERMWMQQAENWFDGTLPFLGFDERDDESTEYIRADVVQAQLDVERKRIAELEGEYKLHRESSLADFLKQSDEHKAEIERLKSRVIFDCRQLLAERDARIAELECAVENAKSRWRKEAIDSDARIAELEAAQRKAHELKYYIGNPSAWQNYDESVSEAIREAVNITGKAQ